MNEYLLSIDFASKLGWSLWDKTNKELLCVSSFNFSDKTFLKTFKNIKFQDKIYEKVIYEKSKANELINNIFKQIPEDSKVAIIIEFSDFGFKYSIERISRILGVFLLELNNFISKRTNIKIEVSTITAVMWRKLFKEKQPDFNWKTYTMSTTTKSNKNRSLINWKVLAKDWSEKYVKENKCNLNINLNNNDITDSIIIGWTYLQ